MTVIEQLQRCNDKCKSIVLERDKGIIPRVIGGNLKNPDLMVVGLNPGKCDTTERFLFKEYGANDPSLTVRFTNHFLVDSDGYTYGGKLKGLFIEIFGKDYLKRVYLSNLIKCESAVNGTVDSETIDHCYGKFLKQEIEALKPKVILALSKTVYSYLKKCSYPNIIQCVHPSTRGNQLKFWGKDSTDRKALVIHIKKALGWKRGDIFSLLSDEDLEDIIGLFLQITKGYAIYPSTCKADTALIEYVLVAKDSGERAYIQVKSGETGINMDDFQGLPGLVYLFAASGRYMGEKRNNITVINKTKITEFVETHKMVMPERVKYWLGLSA